MSCPRCPTLDGSPCTNPACPNAIISAGVQLPDTTIGRRLGSSGVEYLLCLLAEMFTGSLIGVLSIVPILGTAVGVLIGGLFSLCAALYWAVKDTAGGRRSLGKRLGTMQVVDAATGRQATNSQAVIRNSYFIVASLIAMIPGIEVLGWALFATAAGIDSALIFHDGGGRRMGDHLAGTQVVPDTRKR